MKRSKKELEALKAGYETSLLVKSFVENVIAASDPEDDIAKDIEWLKDAESYTKWFETLKTN